MQRNSSFFWLSDSIRNRSNSLSSRDDDGGNSSTGGEEIGLPVDHDGSSDRNNRDFVVTEAAAVASPRRASDISLEDTATELAPLIGSPPRNTYSGNILQRIVSPHPARGKDSPKSTSDNQRFLFPYFSKDSPTRTQSNFRNFQLPIYKRTTINSIRFQVVIWHIGLFDVCQGQVPMRFRITIFWNDDQTQQSNKTSGSDSNSNTQPPVFTMEGRKRAIRHHLSHNDLKMSEIVDVPPVSILNAVTFDTMGSAEVVMVDEKTRLMRWTCMYNATLFQGDHMRVDEFPHDMHTLKIKIGILALRGPKSRWDRKLYRLDFATEEDSRGSTEVPHGLILDHVYIPDFVYDKQSLSFEFVPLGFGSDQLTGRGGKDQYLQVSLPVQRVSGYYDRSVMPILALLNVAAITCLPRNFASATASTETILSIAFVQIGMRLTIDSRLPNVGYEIKIQKVLNRCFWLLCALVFETNFVFFLVTKRGWKIRVTDYIDLASAILALLYTFYIVFIYYGNIKSIKMIE